MDLELTDEQIWLADSVAQLLARSSDDETWHALIEFGALEIASGEEGLGAVELVLVGEELGRSLASVPFIDTAAARYAARGVAPAEHPVLATLNSARGTVGLCLLEPGGGWGLEGSATSIARCDGGVLVIEGQKAAVQHAPAATQLLVLCHDAADERRLAVIDRADAAIRIVPTPSIDCSLDTAAVAFDGVEVPEARSLPPEQSAVMLERLLAIGALLAASEAVGAAARLIELARDYAAERRQFGRSIASFQALRHLLADMYVKQTSAWSTVLFSAAALEDGGEHSLRAASIAKAYTSRSTLEVAHGALQVFGGIAFTAEHPAHRYLRRIVARGAQFGDARHHERMLGRELAAIPRLEELVR